MSGEDTADGALKPFIVTVLLVEGQWHRVMRLGKGNLVRELPPTILWPSTEENTETVLAHWHCAHT